ncbi:HAD-IIIA family hydrolase [Desulfovibrio sp. OttesenSCG-928-G15]|nr:HAD-IIIA family hydrolase [Desulfovibrio sp. OttesenSCG-928-G15]
MPRITTVLLDRDGTIIEDKHYLSKPEGVKLLPGVADSLSHLTKLGIRLFVVSNQSGIGRGMFPREAADAVNKRMSELLQAKGVTLTDIIYCPHAPEAGCNCRKPSLGMWQALQKAYGIKPEETMMIGDKEEDILFGANANLALRGLVLTGKGPATAASLEIILPRKGACIHFVDSPDVPRYPHLVLSSFFQLDEVVRLLSMRQGWSCGA